MALDPGVEIDDLPSGEDVPLEPGSSLAPRKTQPVREVGRPSDPWRATLSHLFKEIGYEISDAMTGETRIERVIRAMYLAAGKGRPEAAKVIFDRGWGPMPSMKVDLSKELINAAKALGLTCDDIQGDARTLELFQLAGLDPALVSKDEPTGSGRA